MIMVGSEILRIERTGGAYTDSVFGAQTNPSVVIKVVSVNWMYNDRSLSIDIPATEGATQPETIDGGFKLISIGLKITGYLDALPTGDSVEVKKKKLWNIAEFGRPDNTYIHFRGAYLFGLGTGVPGQIKILSLDMKEDATVSEPAVYVSSSSPTDVTEPKRVYVTMQIKKSEVQT
uniref:Uncharacterized protein n=1 Tax=viral metagenome TaxID=1070528 RepID=A0A6M3IJ74_9ZZZZ